MRRAFAAEIVLLAAMLVVMRLMTGLARSHDLLAVWLAGLFFDPASPGSVYAGSAGIFTMEPPGPWVEHVLASGIETAVYPFIYPPLWAWLASLVVPLTDFRHLALVFDLVNPVLVILSLLLALRICPPAVGRTTSLLLALPLVGLTLPFVLSLEEGQPQILVSFLILLAIERTARAHPVAGGIALALAASIKVYPALFALFWLAMGERRATLVFALAGGGLGLLSIAVAGWPMHAAFLNELRAISSGALYSLANFSVDPMIARHLFADQLETVSTAVTGGSSRWRVVAKTASWKGLDVALQIAVIGGLALLARRRPGAAFFWPAALLWIALVSPLSWVYHLSTALVFLPALFLRLNLFSAAALSVLLFLTLRVQSLGPDWPLAISLPLSHEVAFLALGALALAFLFLAVFGPDRPLRPDRRSL